MAPVTTRNRPKPFAWSYSKLKNFEACPKKHWHLEIAKDVHEEESEQLKWGNTVHKLLAEYVSGKHTQIPEAIAEYKPWCDKIIGDGTGRILVEQKMAITADFAPTSWFSDDVWFRAIGDVIKVVGSVALIADYKTGKLLEDGSQLALAAACVFAHFPEVQRVRSEFIWLKEDATTRQDFKREEMAAMWKGLWPRIEALRHAHETQSYPAKPGGLCRRWCPIRSCPHYGE